MRGSSLHIASWNVNSVRIRLGLIERLLAAHPVDILCLQEIKCEESQFPLRFFRKLGFAFHAINGQRGYHGVAILSRVPIAPEPVHDWQANGEARHVAVRLPGGAILHNVYVPAGGAIPDRAHNPKFGQKLDFLGRMTDWAAHLPAQGTGNILVGDFNIAPHPADVWSHKALLDVVSHTPVEVAALEALQRAHDWIDLGRRTVPLPAKLYTWWSYRARDWRESNRGRRLDHVWCSPVLGPMARQVETVVEARGWDRPSDHVPLIAEFVF